MAVIRMVDPVTLAFCVISAIAHGWHFAQHHKQKPVARRGQRAARKKATAPSHPPPVTSS